MNESYNGINIIANSLLQENLGHYLVIILYENYFNKFSNKTKLNILESCIKYNDISNLYIFILNFQDLTHLMIKDIITFLRLNFNHNSSNLCIDLLLSQNQINVDSSFFILCVKYFPDCISKCLEKGVSLKLSLFNSIRYNEFTVMKKILELDNNLIYSLYNGKSIINYSIIVLINILSDQKKINFLRKLRLKSIFTIINFLLSKKDDFTEKQHKTLFILNITFELGFI